LVDERRWQYYQEKVQKLNELKNVWKTAVLSPRQEDLQEVLLSLNSAPLKTGIKVQELLKRPEVTLNKIREFLPGAAAYSTEVLEEAEIEIKYTGYIQKQEEEIVRFSKLEDKKLSATLDYAQVRGLSTEGRQRLAEVQPGNIGQASRITGVTPADISVLLVFLEQERRKTQHV
jgi:tRNA uridine 5-carboxymethylaminomethyl modification enzyme